VAWITGRTFDRAVDEERPSRGMASELAGMVLVAPGMLLLVAVLLEMVIRAVFPPLGDAGRA